MFDVRISKGEGHGRILLRLLASLYLLLATLAVPQGSLGHPHYDAFCIKVGGRVVFVGHCETMSVLTAVCDTYCKIMEGRMGFSVTHCKIMGAVPAVFGTWKGPPCFIVK